MTGNGPFRVGFHILLLDIQGLGQFVRCGLWDGLFSFRLKINYEEGCWSFVYICQGHNQRYDAANEIASPYSVLTCSLNRVNWASI
ncbi:hypothetical protein Hdeb2414_s0028g00698361 [Helianthus debilis subsp. tardiflorus]